MLARASRLRITRKPVRYLGAGHSSKLRVTKAAPSFISLNDLKVGKLPEKRIKFSQAEEPKGRSSSLIY
jgi:hypothetical protein